MGSKKNRRQVAFKHEYDRLGHKKMEKVYDILFSKVLADSNKSRIGQISTGFPVGECKLARRASSEARNVETGATVLSRWVSTKKKKLELVHVGNKQ